MDEQEQKTEQPAEVDVAGLARWQKILGVVYRLVIIVGILSFALGAVLVILTDIIPFWFMTFPILLVIIGIILARFEYVFHKRQKFHSR
ncbi:MAG: hypothetical protein RQ728_01440 [Brevefilum sp.]|nr:hypothetical protein [Brevefilum sp.]MDT8380903.1 hypothetical protein [Brevefilum sp.]MDW7754219.1 hypothetical protein [Brevefilum sp.]